MGGTLAPSRTSRMDTAVASFVRLRVCGPPGTCTYRTGQDRPGRAVLLDSGSEIFYNLYVVRSYFSDVQDAHGRGRGRQAWQWTFRVSRTGRVSWEGTGGYSCNYRHGQSRLWYLYVSSHVHPWIYLVVSWPRRAIAPPAPILQSRISSITQFPSPASPRGRAPATIRRPDLNSGSTGTRVQLQQRES